MERAEAGNLGAVGELAGMSDARDRIVQAILSRHNFPSMPMSISAPGYWSQTPAGAVTGAGVRDDALRGELGYLSDPIGRVNTELSLTVEDPRLNSGKPTNIPSLVAGQVGIPQLQGGDPVSGQQYEAAVVRAVQRQQAGASLPFYEALDEAIAAATNRPESAKRPYRR